MGFSGKFVRKPSPRAHNAMLISFTLKCTNLFMGETVDIGIFPSNGGQPWYFRNQKLKAGKCYDFDYDTVGWNWYNHDTIAILGKNDKVLQKWELRLKEYAPGECPQCHGTRKCKKCGGQGYVYPKGETWKYTMCQACMGTGICQECDVPQRGPNYGGMPRGIGNGY